MTSSPSPSPVSRSRFAQNDVEAEDKFQRHKSENNDPFPSIPPALLNSADIEDYVAATGMIYPFNEKKLKSASYEVELLGTCHYWDDNGKAQTFYIQKGKEFILKQNSIAFVCLEAKFRLPDYIAIRFNLKITNVHKGILLGTGPLVDPGFEGNLVIPLHNLTTNDYTLVGGNGLIWIEFTKLSPTNSNSRGSDVYPRQGTYIPFPDLKKNKSIEYYLHNAQPFGIIRSSIPDAIQDARQSARTALNTVKVISITGLIASLAVGYALFDSYKQSAAMVQDTTIYVKDARQELEELKNTKEELNKLRIEVKLLKQQMREMQKQPVQPSK